MNNHFYMEFDAISENEAFARLCVAAFVMPLDPTLEELGDIKTAVSEAVTNCIIHGYDKKGGTVKLTCDLDERMLTVMVEDEGLGIEDINKAMEPAYTSKPQEERSGMGFTFMEIFMDELVVNSLPGHGTTVVMRKTIE